MIKHKQRGFTLVELLIVIVVIAILAAISVVAYSGVQQRAQDSQILSAAQQIQKAYVSSVIVGGTAYLGGYSSSYNSGTNTCSGGYGGWVDDAPYSYNPNFCTIGTVLIAGGDIPPSLIKNLPKTNKVQTDYTSGNRTMMINRCTTNSFALTYALNAPRLDQQSQLEDACNGGNSWDPFSIYGMNAGVIFTLPS